MSKENDELKAIIRGMGKRIRKLERRMGKEDPPDGPTVSHADLGTVEGRAALLEGKATYVVGDDE